MRCVVARTMGVTREWDTRVAPLTCLFQYRAHSSTWAVRSIWKIHCAWLELSGKHAIPQNTWPTDHIGTMVELRSIYASEPRDQDLFSILFWEERRARPHRLPGNNGETSDEWEGMRII